MKREVHKFGGASVRDAEAVRNVGRIVQGVVRSRDSTGCGRQRDGQVHQRLGEGVEGSSRRWAVEARCAAVLDFHTNVVRDLSLPAALLRKDVAELLSVAESLNGKAMADAKGYDAIVGFGERLSTRIVHAHLMELGVPAQWLSAWHLIRTDETHRTAQVDLSSTGEAIRRALSAMGGGLAVTQGFVGGTVGGIPTTLGQRRFRL